MARTSAALWLPPACSNSTAFIPVRFFVSSSAAEVPASISQQQHVYATGELPQMPAYQEYSTAGMAPLFLVLLPLPLGLWLVFARHQRHRVDETWDCGLDRLTPQMEYTATAYSKALRMIFRAIYRPRRRIQADFAVPQYFTKSIRFESQCDSQGKAKRYL
jgi:hypothetical protein